MKDGYTCHKLTDRDTFDKLIHEKDLMIHYYAYEGTEPAENGETRSVTSIYTGFDYPIENNIHVYLNDLGSFIKVPGKPSEIKEGTYKKKLQGQIIDFLESAIVFD